MERISIQLRHALQASRQAFDTTAHNMANVDTPGYKTREVTFSSVYYDMLKNQPGGETAGQDGRTTPEYVRSGLGARVSGTPLLSEVQGPLQATGQPTHLAIQGRGYFKLRLRSPENAPGGVMGGGDDVYARAGSFHWSVEGTVGNERLFLVDARGRYVLNTNDQPIEIGNIIPLVMTRSVVISPEGEVLIQATDEEVYPTGQYIALYAPTRPDALMARGDGAYQLAPGDTGIRRLNDAGGSLALSGTRLIQGALERSTVDLTEEMTHLIEQERHIQLLARHWQMADQMAALANEIGRRNA